MKAEPIRQLTGYLLESINKSLGGLAAQKSAADQTANNTYNRFIDNVTNKIEKADNKLPMINANNYDPELVSKIREAAGDKHITSTLA